MRLLFLSALLILPLKAIAHELWIEPVQYKLQQDAKVQARLVNGEAFRGMELAYFPNRIEAFSVHNGEDVIHVETRIGNKPALEMNQLPQGLNTLVYQSKPSELTYKDPKKFENFLSHKDLHFTMEDHIARGLTPEKITEVYTRFSKSLIAIGEGIGNDQEIGLLTEIVALTNPYQLDGPMQVKLLYQGEARANEQIEIFERAPDESVLTKIVRTDGNGIATIPVQANHEYMLDAVVMRIPSEADAKEYSAMWQSLWANLTFFVPE